MNNENVFTPFVDLYYEINEAEYLEYTEYLNSLKKLEFGKNNRYSSFIDWSKMIQKASVPSEKLSESMVKQNNDSINEIFRSVLSLKERNWYEEICQLYKVKNILTIL